MYSCAYPYFSPIFFWIFILIFKVIFWGFPGGAVVKNPPANAGTRVQALVREDLTCRGATKPVHHNYWTCALEPASHNYWACMPRAHAPQQDKPLQWEACAQQRRIAPTCHKYRKSALSNKRSNAAKNK